jgi:ribonuclease HI
MPPRRSGELLTPEEVLAKHRAGPRAGVFTDGSCEGNPGPGGWGVVWVEDDRVVEERHGFDPETTNNRMELRALIEAYRMLDPRSEVTVYSDSQLCVNTVNEWASGWAARGWRRKAGPIANLELVKELYGLARSRPGVRLEWIASHDGSRWNEYADALATTYLREGRA